jgi:hypothetical protein
MHCKPLNIKKNNRRHKEIETGEINEKIPGILGIINGRRSSTQTAPCQTCGKG